MAKYFLHLRSQCFDLFDEDGIESSSVEDLRARVLRTARDLICGDVTSGEVDLRCRIDAEDETGALTYSLRFGDAITILA